MRVLVTGAGGYVGLNLVVALAGRCRLRCLARRSEPLTAILDESNVRAMRHDIELFQGDIFDVEVLRKALHGIEAVVHLAGLTSDENPNQHRLLDVNVLGTQVLLEAAATENVTRVIFPSTYHVYGRLSNRAPGPVDEAQPINPASVYATSKALAEALVRRSPMATVILRLSHLYGVGVGRGDWGGVLVKMIDEALADYTITLDTRAGDIRDYLHIAEAVGCLRAVTLNPRPLQGTYNVGRGESVTLQEMAEWIAEAVARVHGHSVAVRLPAGYNAPPGRAYLDLTNIRTACGFVPQCSPTEGIEELIERLVPAR